MNDNDIIPVEGKQSENNAVTKKSGTNIWTIVGYVILAILVVHLLGALLSLVVSLFIPCVIVGVIIFLIVKLAR